MKVKVDHLPKLFDVAKTHFSTTTYFWEYLFIDEDRYRMKPNIYQRASVWTEQQQIAYIEYVLSGGINGKNIYLNRLSYADSAKFGYDYDIIDGQQRLLAVKNFLDNKFKVFGLYYRSDIESLTSRYCKFDALIVENYTLEDQIKLYISINTTGVPHTDNEIKKALNILKDVKNG